MGREKGNSNQVVCHILDVFKTKLFKTELFYLVLTSLFKKRGAGLSRRDRPNRDEPPPPKGLHWGNSS